MSEMQKRVAVFTITFVFVFLALISFALADPEGWAIWRVALVAWVPAAVVGLFASTCPFSELLDDDDLDDDDE